jgi:putative transposase
MSWLETNPVIERVKFIAAYTSGLYRMSELCAHFGVSRPTGYQWVARFAAEGAAGLEDRSHAPHRCPHLMAETTKDLVLDARAKHPYWGSAKLRVRLIEENPLVTIPARSRIDALLRREGKLRQRRARPGNDVHPGSTPLVAEQPNDLWTIDFKGEFRVGDGSMCFPLTVQDASTRFLPGITILRSTASDPVRAALEVMFRQHGMPLRMRSDNGAPFVASTAWRGLSRLSVWWIQLGIRHERNRRGCPQDNPRHERMHRTLKEETARPPQPTLAAQQVRTDVFRAEYNHLRPHESHDQKTPGSLYSDSPRAFPERLAGPEYAGHLEKRRVSSEGDFTFHGHSIFLSKSLAGQWIALEETDHHVWSIMFYDVLVARLNDQTLRVSG